MKERKRGDLNHLSVHQRLRAAILDSQQPTSPIGFLFLKLPPLPCAVLLVCLPEGIILVMANMNWLVVWNMAFMTFHSVGNFILPTDEFCIWKSPSSTVNRNDPTTFECGCKCG